MKNANDNYKHYTGTSTWYKYNFGFTLTDGAKQLAEDYQCFWFLDIITSYFTNKKVRQEGFQVWKLTRVSGERFSVVCEDGNHNVVVKQDVKFSSFQDDYAELWCIDKVILLPSEY